MKLKKNLKFGLISGLCTTTLVAGAILATSCSTTKTDAKPVLSATPENSVYHTITFIPGEAGVTLTGKTVIEVRDGNKWSSVKKPAAEKYDYTLVGWQYERTAGDWQDLENSTQVTGDWTIRPKFTPNEHKFTVVGGNYSITDAIATIADSDDNAWHLNDNGTPVQDTENVVFSLAKNEETDPDLPTWLGIGDGTGGHDKGKVYWTNSVAATPLLKFKIKATYKTKEYFSETIFMHVNAARYEILDGNVSLFGKFGATGEDNKTWALYKNGEKVTPVTAYTLSIYSEEEPQLPNHISLVNNVVNWDASLSVGKHYFVVNCTYEDKQTASATITLDISPVSTKLFNGNTLIETTETTTSQETNEWKLSVDGVEQSNVKWELDPIEPTTLPTGLDLVGSSPNYSGVIKYDKVPNGKYTFKITGTTTDAMKYNASETIHMIVTASEASITGGPTVVNITDEQDTTSSDLFSLMVDGAVRQDAQWAIKSISPTPAVPSSVSIAPITSGEDKGKGQLKFTNVHDGTYQVEVNGYVQDKPYSATKSFTLVVKQATTDLKFVCDEASGETLTGVQQVEVIKNLGASQGTQSPTTFANVNKPVASKPGYYFDKWVYQGTATEVVPGATFADSTTVVPTFKLNPVVVIAGSSEMYVTTSQTYSASSPATSNADGDFTWRITKWTGDTTLSPEINPETGELTAKNANGVVTIEAFDNVTKISATKDVAIYFPWQYSKYFWVYGNFETATKNEWFYFTPENAGSTGDIILNHMEGQGAGKPTIPRATSGDIPGFDSTVYVGDYVSTIPQWFLADCTNFDSQILFSDNSQCTVIEEGFLDTCTKFNKKLNLPKSISTIWDNFMHGCVAYNDSGDASDFELPENITHIGAFFMEDCIKFNKSFTVPAGVRFVGNGFLRNCDSMSGVTVTIDCDYKSFDKTGDIPLSFSTDNIAAAYATNGIFIGGDDRLDILREFPNWPVSTPSGNYRNLNTV